MFNTVSGMFDTVSGLFNAVSGLFHSYIPMVLLVFVSIRFVFALRHRVKNFILSVFSSESEGDSSSPKKEYHFKNRKEAIEAFKNLLREKVERLD